MHCLVWFVGCHDGGKPPSAISNLNTVSSQPFSAILYEIGNTGSEMI